MSRQFQLKMDARTDREGRKREGRKREGESH